MAQQEYTAIRCTPDAKELAEESKRDDETWDEFIQRCTENPPKTVNVVPIDDLEDALDAIDVDADGGASPDDVAAAAERGVERALKNAAMK